MFSVPMQVSTLQTVILLQSQGEGSRGNGAGELYSGSAALEGFTHSSSLPTPRLTFSSTIDNAFEA